MHDLHAPVEALMREVGETIIMRRFRNLAAGEVAEKTPGDLVTIADRESEARLSAGLPALLPGSRVVGEEATAETPELIDDLGSGHIWVIDPLDGTMNYAAGIRPFAVMVALLHEGRCEAGWIFDPVTGRMCHAFSGGGTWVDGARVAAPPRRAGLPVAAIAEHFLTAEERAAISAKSTGKLELVPIPRCAGEQYPRLFLGENDVAIFQRTMPWDHLAGALMVEEAGGVVSRRDGTPYRATIGGRGLIAAGSSQAWDVAMDLFR